YSKTRRESDLNIYCQSVEWAPTLEGLLAILSTGDTALQRIKENEHTNWMLDGIRDASNLVGSVTGLAWSPDGYTLAVAWANCGWALWSVFGGLLHTSLGERIGLADRVRLSHLAWSASGYHLLGFLSFEPSKRYEHCVPVDKIAMADPHSVSTHQHPVSSIEKHKTTQDVSLRDVHLAVFHIARSSLTVNPTLVSILFVVL
ncbi:hypothetical protein EG68_11979, partial [Paragonimus skrjabini miyazakii]